MSRDLDEIVRVLQAVKDRHNLVMTYLPGGKFQALLRYVEPRGRFLIIGRSPVPGANAALLQRPRWTFHAELPEWHVECALGGARETLHNGVAAFEFGFPDLIVCHQPRAHPRVPVEPEAQLKCIANTRGHAAFEAHIVDISAGGVGFIVYSPAIPLETGTMLLGCRIQAPDGAEVEVDLEVRYTKPVDSVPGQPAIRSGCRLVNPSAEALALIRLYVGSDS
jgi:c-di-GMP-binding flagellar brake protein YcgR